MFLLQARAYRPHQAHRAGLYVHENTRSNPGSRGSNWDELHDDARRFDSGVYNLAGILRDGGNRSNCSWAWE